MNQTEMLLIVGNLVWSGALLVSWVALWLKQSEVNHIRYEYGQLRKKFDKQNMMMNIMMKDRG